MGKKTMTKKNKRVIIFITKDNYRKIKLAYAGLFLAMPKYIIYRVQG